MSLLSPRWHGAPGRLEVVYATVSDPGRGLGLWVHHELLSPLEGEAVSHGWVALFRPPTPPVLERFGPQPAPVSTAPRHGGDGDENGSATAGGWPAAGDAVLEPPAMRGKAGALSWDLSWDEPDAAPLFTFPSWAWEREVLPGAQIVPVPTAVFSGTVAVEGTAVALSPEARGGVAHIYGHGNAERWGWLHAELGDGDVLEVVAATSRRPGLDRLPPMPFVQVRLAAKDWPRDPLAAAPLLRARLGLPHWSVRGTVGRWRLRVEVDIPADQAVTLDYRDPDGAGATCTNSEVADADVVLEHRRSRWETEATWRLRGTAHAEIGSRP
ncbi:MAG TPA: hypothetical protein DCQ30_13135 [Acidimicrobiaceae bacterium]|nr:hypothetical protein [Acidimicrobiaceae bacterium]